MPWFGLVELTDLVLSNQIWETWKTDLQVFKNKVNSGGKPEKQIWKTRELLAVLPEKVAGQQICQKSGWKTPQTVRIPS